MTLRGYSNRKPVNTRIQYLYQRNKKILITTVTTFRQSQIKKKNYNCKRILANYDLVILGSYVLFKLNHFDHDGTNI